MRRNPVKRAIDTGLSSLYLSERDRRAVMQRAMEGKTVKKKLSIALVVFALLACLAAGAIAAALGGVSFVQEVLAPRASQDGSERFSREEMAEILEAAKENGIELPEDALAYLERSDGEYKEELMRLFVKTDLGFYPSTWSIEAQAWYDQLLIDCGLSEARVRMLPGEGEIEEPEALRIAQEHIRTKYGETAELTDASLFRRHVEYRVADEEGNVRWYIGYEPLNLENAQYDVVITPQGEMQRDSMQPGINQNGISTPQEILDRFNGLYGMYYDWTPQTWVIFHAMLEESAAVHGLNDFRSLRPILYQEFAVPEAEDLTRADAIRRAAELAEEQGLWHSDISEKALLSAANAFCLMDGDAKVWRVLLPKLEETESCWVEMDARSGRLRAAGSSLKDRWSERVVLDAVAALDLRERHAPGEITLNTNTSYERALQYALSGYIPPCWRDVRVPGFYWEQMEALNYGPETAQALTEEWVARYGVDQRIWPIEIKQLICLWTDSWASDDGLWPGLPGPEEVDQTRAEEIAMAAFRRTYGENWGAGIDLALNFWKDYAGTGRSFWLVEALDTTLLTGDSYGIVTIDAGTGAVLAENIEPGGNG